MICFRNEYRLASQQPFALSSSVPNSRRRLEVQLTYVSILNIDRRVAVRDEEYGYLACRLAVEQNLARTALCCTAAAAHQGLANTYRARLQSLTLSPASYGAERSLPSRQEWLIAKPAADEFNTNSATRVAYAEQGNLV